MIGDVLLGGLIVRAVHIVGVVGDLLQNFGIDHASAFDELRKPDLVVRIGR